MTDRIENARVTRAKEIAASFILNALANDDNNEILTMQHVGSSRFLQNWDDVDVIVLLNGGMDPAYWAPNTGVGRVFESCALEEYESGDSLLWAAKRCGSINLICTIDPEWYSKFTQADEVVCALRLREKVQRIIVHRVVRDSLEAEAAIIEATEANDNDLIRKLKRSAEKGALDLGGGL